MAEPMDSEFHDPELFADLGADDFDGPWMETCPKCGGAGTLPAQLGLVTICDRCGGATHIEHRHQPELAD